MAALSGHSFLLGVISYVLFVKFVDPWYTTCVQGDPVSFDYSIKHFIYRSINVCVCVRARVRVLYYALLLMQCNLGACWTGVINKLTLIAVSFGSICYALLSFMFLELNHKCARFLFLCLDFYFLALKLLYISHFMACLCLKDECNEDVKMNGWQPKCIE